MTRSVKKRAYHHVYRVHGRSFQAHATRRSRHHRFPRVLRARRWQHVMHQTSLVRVSSVFFSRRNPLMHLLICRRLWDCYRALSGAPKDALRVETNESRETKNKRRDSFFVSMIGTRAASSIRADFSVMGRIRTFFFEKSIRSAYQTTRTLKKKFQLFFLN